MSTVRVTFEPGGQRKQVPRGTLISEAAAIANIDLATPCGGKGQCGQCQVLVKSGEANDPTDAELEHLSSDQLRRGRRLACQTRLMGDTVVEIIPQVAPIVEKSLGPQMARWVPLEPAVRQELVQLSEPVLDDQRSDLRRLADAVADKYPQLTATPSVLRNLPTAVRAEDQRVAAVIHDNQLIAIYPHREAPRCLGAAVDIGTSTMALYLIDLQDGEQLSSAARANSQAQYGLDVVSRIDYANTHAAGLAQLRRKVLGDINELIAEAVDKVSADQQEIYEVTIVGNTCMHHLFLGLEPRYLAEAPYVPVATEPLNLTAGEAGLDINPEANVFCLPCIAGFVGADTVGVIAATEMTHRQQPVLAIDLGTNGEIALWTGESLLVASCAAGPAFEGSEIQQGMRAAPGAIDHVFIRDGDIEITTIANQPATGICGSGLLDAVAVLLELGVIDNSGRFIDDEVPSELSAAVADRLEGEKNLRRIILTDECRNGQVPVALTQRDVREFQLAKGAVRAGIDILLDYAGLSADDLSEVLIAGAFGNYMRAGSALRVGLLPNIPEDRVKGVGNAAGAGAGLALISQTERSYACQVAEAAQHIELFRRPEFQNMFAEQMLFP